ncbi:MAG: hypothetical protein RSA27_00460 [Oscillospiraceae bacterium]
MINRYFTEFNDTLTSQLTPPNKETAIRPTMTPVTTPKTEPAKIEIPAEMGEGYLIVQVFIANMSIPIEGAHVTITKTVGDTQEIIKKLTTDKSGRTEQLALPAPSRKLSQNPGTTSLSYGVYNTYVEQAGYYVEENLNVPIFDGIRSIQPISLTPILEGDTNPHANITNESEPKDL